MRGPYGPPASWTIKPPLGSQINAGHDLANNLQDLFLFNEMGGKTANNIGPSGVGALTSSAFLWGAAQMPYGGGLKVGASSQTCVTGFTATIPTQVSLVLVFQRTAVAVTNGIIATLRQSGTSNNQISFQYDSGAANLVLNMATSANSPKAINIATANIVTNTWYVLAASFDRNAGTIAAWLNQTAFSGSPGQASAVATASHSIALGGNSGGGGSQGATVALFARYNRLLLAQEAAQLYENPWCFMAPPALRRYWIMSAGGNLFTSSLSGAMTSSGGLVRATSVPLAGALASSGALTKADAKALAGAMASGGVLVKADSKALSGSLPSSGALARADNKALAGSLSSSGSVAKTTAKSLAGGASSSGSLAKADTRSLVGSMNSAGAITRATFKPLSGAASPSGSLAKTTAKPLSGSLSSSGALSSVFGFSKDLAGTLTSAGSVARALSKPLTGALSPSGALVRRTTKALSGTLSPSGALSKLTARVLDGALSPVGTLSAALARLRSFSGDMGSSGALARAKTVSLSGVLDATGSLAHTTLKVLSGILDAVGTLVRLRAGVKLTRPIAIPSIPERAEATADIPGRPVATAEEE